MKHSISLFAVSFAFTAACTPHERKAEAPAEPEKQEEVKAQEPEKKPEPAVPSITLTKSLEGAKVFFKSPADGAKVKSPVTLEFGIEGMTVTKAGDDAEGSGHHHLIIDADLPALDAPIPANDNYIHFGDGSTSTTRELAPGEHKIQLILGDHRHIPHDPPVYSEVITITVE
ncbi:MAG: DUF4399 domain-containing protein [Myxococcota bacterium]